LDCTFPAINGGAEAVLKYFSPRPIDTKD